MRLVPYRSLDQHNADGTTMAAANAVGALAARLLTNEAHPLVILLSVGGAILATALLSVLFASWRARRESTEMISRDESLKCYFAERSSRPVWESMAALGLQMSFTVMVMLLAILPFRHWWTIVPFATTAAGIIGAIWGGYIWTYARAYTRAVRALTESQQGLSPTPFAQVAMRHYAGYALGLAFALIGATLVESREIALAAVVIGFFVGKITSDALMPAVYYATPPETPITLRTLAASILFAIAWWGIPFGALLALAAQVIVPDATAIGHAVTFALTSLGAVVFSLFMQMTMRLTRGRPV